jgi:hypothetical protein
MKTEPRADSIRLALAQLAHKPEFDWGCFRFSSGVMRIARPQPLL